MNDEYIDTISDTILKNGDWPLSDNDDTVETLEDAERMIEFVREAFEVMVTTMGDGEFEMDFCTILTDGAACINMYEWVQITRHLIKIHRPSARHMTWLLCRYSNPMNYGDFFSHFISDLSAATLTPLDLEYLTSSLDHCSTLLLWAKRLDREEGVQRDGPFTLEFAKRILRLDPSLDGHCYHWIYASILRAYDLQTVLDCVLLHSVHFVKILASLALQSSSYILMVPSQFSIGVDEASQLYAYDASHPWTGSQKSREDLDFIHRHRDEVSNVISQVIPILPLVSEIKGYLFDIVYTRCTRPVRWEPSSSN